MWLKFGIASYWMNSYWGGAVAAIGGALLLGALARILRRASCSRRDVLFAIGLAILANSRPYEGLIFSLPPLIVLTTGCFKIPRLARGHARRRAGRVALPIASSFAANRQRSWASTTGGSLATLCFFRTR